MRVEKSSGLNPLQARMGCNTRSSACVSLAIEPVSILSGRGWVATWTKICFAAPVGDQSQSSPGEDVLRRIISDNIKFIGEVSQSSLGEDRLQRRDPSTLRRQQRRLRPLRARMGCNC